MDRVEKRKANGGVESVSLDSLLGSFALKGRGWKGVHGI